MTAYAAEPSTTPLRNGGDAELAWLIRQARAADPALAVVGRRELLRMAREFAAARELDLRDRQARQASADEFGDWLRSNYWPLVDRRTAPRLGDRRRDGWRQR